MRRYDCIVVGLGAIGSATLYHLAKGGRKVLGIEQFASGHDFGSSHGDSRIIREQYFEHPLYVPLVQRAYELWVELEQATYRPLMTITGGLMIGPRDGVVVTGAMQSAKTHGLAHELLSAAEIHARFPAFRPARNDVAVLDRRAGFLAADACNQAHIDAAKAKGAEARFEEPLVSWESNAHGVRVVTERETYECDRLLLSTGAWAKEMLLDSGIPLTIEREVLFWFEPDDASLYDSDRFPVFCHEYARGRITFGVARTTRGVKAGIHHSQDFVASPGAVQRTVGDHEVDQLRELLRHVVPGLARAKLRESAVCLYTNTPDENFIVDWHPRSDRVLVSSPCSGHGFKFASVLGEIQAELLTSGKTAFDLTPFRIDRFIPN